MKIPTYNLILQCNGLPFDICLRLHACFLLDYCKWPVCAQLQNKLPSTLQPSLQFVRGRPHLKYNPTWNLAQTNQLEQCQSRRHTLLCSKPIRVEVWHFARGENLPLDALITHHLAVANVFTTVDPLLGFLQRLSSFFGQSSMESRQQWLTRLKNELSNSPLVSNVAFGFILMGLEKLVELEFECPCNPTWNGVFSSAFFIIPAVMAFTLMLIIQGCRCDTWCRKTVSLSSFVPAIVWLILLFLDGQYFACAMTDWEGRFVLVDKAAPQKWCEPISEGDVTPQELMLRSQQLFVFSQVSWLFFPVLQKIM